MSRTAKTASACALLLILIICGVVYPVYPSAMSVCDLLNERARLEDRFSSPHRGATFVLSGKVYGTPRKGLYLLEADCGKDWAFAGVQLSPVALRTLYSNRMLDSLRNTNPEQERIAPVTMVVRVKQDVTTCFGPGLILTALAIHVTGAATQRPTPPGDKVWPPSR
jgi:hypothetical protein